MRLVKGAVLTAIVIVAAGFGALAYQWKDRLSPPSAEPSPGIGDAIGGDFELTNHNRESMRLSDLRGKVALLFFGYTHCPDICPATLYLMRQVRDALGPHADDFQGVFVSVDPARDTPERLREYVGFFDPTLIALTGTQDQITSVTKLYAAGYELGQPADDGSYVVGHTTFGYLIGRDGKVAALFPGGTDVAEVIEGVRAQLAPNA